MYVIKLILLNVLNLPYFELTLFLALEIITIFGLKLQYLSWNKLTLFFQYVHVTILHWHQ